MSLLYGVALTLLIAVAVLPIVAVIAVLFIRCLDWAEEWLG